MKQPAKLKGRPLYPHGALKGFGPTPLASLDGVCDRWRCDRPVGPPGADILKTELIL